jgi:hypothetical protein
MSDDEDPDWLVERVGPRSSTRIAQCRREAADIREKAKNIKDRTTRERLLEIANQYDALAASIERLRRE